MKFARVTKSLKCDKKLKASLKTKSHQNKATPEHKQKMFQKSF